MPSAWKTCCCCGQYVGHFEQHWNRDTGYGLCEDCIDYCARGETAESFERTYGVAGVHYARIPSPGILRNAD
ncbi:hypothetical protein [Sphingobium yanoikuyae]|nr:hypothetical protein [Sphingobium yanoikuyae]